MALGLGWTLKGDGRTLGPDEVVAPDERLSWGKTVGLGAQHVVAMFGATFVFPLVMGLNPQLAIMMSGIATIAFLLIVEGKVPSYLGTSAAFVGGVAAIRANGGDSAEVTGAILVAGLVLLLVGVLIHVLGSPRSCTRCCPRSSPAPWSCSSASTSRRSSPASTGPGPVGRAPDDGLHDRRRRRLPRLHQPHRGLPRPDLRHRAVLAARQHRRPDHLGARWGHRGDDALPLGHLGRR